MPPVFQAALVRSKDTSHGVDYYKYFTMLLQEISLEADEEYLNQLIEFFRFPGSTRWEEEKLWDPEATVTEPKSLTDGQRMYFEVFQIQPMKLNITFSTSDKKRVTA
jgi:vacuolar protein sorting-associated protein 13A/C